MIFREWGGVCEEANQANQVAPRCQVGPLRVPAVKTFSPLGDSGTLGPWETPSAPRELPPGVRRHTLARVNVRDAHTCALTSIHTMYALIYTLKKIHTMQCTLTQAR